MLVFCIYTRRLIATAALVARLSILCADWLSDFGQAIAKDANISR